ncbi:hypothetical protein [Lacticaseibacillus nasuensis]|uniref:hypothetical protein n=1 Tax=Lacticaseibacillus nasuensis TaxID=944671 RepID=UPI000B29E04B|nr:hypothetical protein [Lacticaseibacillus nasuensis]
MKNEIWALRIIQNWNQAQYVVGKQPLFTTQGEWPEENNHKKSCQYLPSARRSCWVQNRI